MKQIKIILHGKFVFSQKIKIILTLKSKNLIMNFTIKNLLTIEYGET